MKFIPKITFWIVCIIGAVAILPAFADVSTNTQKLAEQRKLFIQAENALNNNQLYKFQELLGQLEDYPLYPYLKYEELIQNLDENSEPLIQEFLKKYKNTPVAEQLRRVWLKKLSNQQDWLKVIEYYQPTKYVSSQCRYLSAKLATGSYQTCLDEITKIWLVGYSQPNACDQLFSFLQQQGGLSDRLIRSRIYLALEQGHRKFAEYLMTLVSEEEQPRVQLLYKIHHSPRLVADESLFDLSADKHKRIIIYGIKKLAKTDPEYASEIWQNWQKKIMFSYLEQKDIANHLAKGYMRQSPKKLENWLTGVDQELIDDSIFEWQIRNLLLQQNWQKLQNVLNDLPTPMRFKHAWLYWYARSLEQQDELLQAKTIFHYLSQFRSYYGFLSSYRLKQGYYMHDSPLNLDEEEFNKIKNLPGILTAHELFALNRDELAKDEWWNVVNELEEKEKYIAAIIAQSYGWGQIALATSSKAAHKDDLKLRFPILYADTIERASRRTSIKPQLIYAMIRQESLFQNDAKSSAGAKGLMQLMPSTAHFVAQTLRQPSPTGNKLYDPTTNIHLGSAYLHRLFKNFSQNPLLAIAAYNAGPNRVKKWLPLHESINADIWIETIPWRETRNYVKNVLTYTMIYQYMTGANPSLKPYMKQIPSRDLE